MSQRTDILNKTQHYTVLAMQYRVTVFFDTFPWHSISQSCILYWTNQSSIKSIKHTPRQSHHGDIRRSRSSHAHGCLEVDHTLHRHRTSVDNIFSMCRRQRRLAHHRRNMEAYQSVHDHVRRTQGFMSTGFRFSGMEMRCCSWRCHRPFFIFHQHLQ